MLRRILLIIGIVLLIILIGVGIWAIFFAEDQAPVQVTDRGIPVFPNSGAGTGNRVTPQKNEGTAKEVTIPRLRQISNVPTAGFTSFERDISFVDTLTEDTDEEADEQSPTLTIFRYVERATGHVYETTEKTLKTSRIINATVPQAQHAVLGTDDAAVIQKIDQNNDNIETVLVTEKSASTTEEKKNVLEEEFGGGREFETTFLPLNATNIVESPDGKDLLYSLTSQNGLTLFKTPLENFATEIVYASPFKSWEIDWVNSDTIQLVTKPDSQISGHLYTYNLNSGEEKRVIGGFGGLTAQISPNLSHILYSHNNGGELDVQIINNNTRALVGIPIDTFADKCAWQPNGTSTVFCSAPSSIEGYNQPESWYRGQSTFNDSIWRIDAQTGQTKLEMKDKSLHDTSFDIDMAQISKDGEYFIFRDKKTGFVWSLDVKDLN